MVATAATTAVACCAGSSTGGNGGGAAARATATAAAATGGAAAHRLAFQALKQRDFLLHLSSLSRFRNGPALLLGAAAVAGGGGRGGGVLRSADSGPQETALAGTVIFSQAVFQVCVCRNVRKYRK